MYSFYSLKDILHLPEFGCQSIQLKNGNVLSQHSAL